jgi:hypothetical protein
MLVAFVIILINYTVGLTSLYSYTVIQLYSYTVIQLYSYTVIQLYSYTVIQSGKALIQSGFYSLYLTLNPVALNFLVVLIFSNPSSI